MTYEEAEQLHEAMQEHRTIWPRRCRITFLARMNEHHVADEITPNRRNMREAARVYNDFGCGIYDPEIDTRVEMWTAGQVDSIMRAYKRQLESEYAKHRGGAGR